MEHRVNNLEQDMAEIKQEMAEIKRDVGDHKTRIALAESNIKDIKDDLSSIKSNTDWLRKAFVNAGITGFVTLMITILGGIIIWAITQ